MKAIYVNNLQELGDYVVHFKRANKNKVRRRGVKLQLVRPPQGAANTIVAQPKDGFFNSLYKDLQWLFRR